MHVVNVLLCLTYVYNIEDTIIDSLKKIGNFISWTNVV